MKKKLNMDRLDGSSQDDGNLKPLPIFEENPVDKVFRIDLTSEQIVAQLDFEDLKNCRVVCHDLAKAASKELLERNITISMISANSKDEDGKFVRDYKNHHFTTNNWTLEDLNNLFKNDLSLPTLPCTSYNFCGGLLDDPDLQTFFALVGPHIKTLTLSSKLYDQDDEAVAGMKLALRKLLIVQAPNITHLTLGRGYGKLNTDSTEESWSLPSLKVLTCHAPYDDQSTSSASSYSDQSLAVKIVEQALNLERVENFQLRDLDFFTKNKKLHLLKGWSFKGQAKSVEEARFRFANIQKFIHVKPKLEKISFELWQDVWGFLSKSEKLISFFHKVLLSSKDTLEELEIVSRGTYRHVDMAFLLVPLPKLHKLKHLILNTSLMAAHGRVRGKSGTSLYFNNGPLARGLNVGQTFSKCLSTVTLKVTGGLNISEEEVSHRLFDYLPDDLRGRFEHVKKLQIFIYHSHAPVPVMFQKYVRRLFPNVIKLRLAVTNECLNETLDNYGGVTVPTFLPYKVLLDEMFGAWKGPQLDTLALDIFGSEVSTTALNEALTGIEKDVPPHCSTVPKSSPSSSTKIVQAGLEKSSIYSLTGLKRLGVTIYDKKLRTEEFVDKLTFDISQLSAFNPSTHDQPPQLRTNIKWKILKSSSETHYIVEEREVDYDDENGDEDEEMEEEEKTQQVNDWGETDFVL